jgi:hypothetical protein
MLFHLLRLKVTDCQQLARLWWLAQSVKSQSNSYHLLYFVVTVAILSFITPLLMLLPYTLVWVWASSSTIARLTPILVAAIMSLKRPKNQTIKPLLIMTFCQLVIIGAIWVAAGMIQNDVFVSTTIYTHLSYPHDFRCKR